MHVCELRHVTPLTPFGQAAGKGWDAAATPDDVTVFSILILALPFLMDIAAVTHVQEHMYLMLAMVVLYDHVISKSDGASRTCVKVLLRYRRIIGSPFGEAHISSTGVRCLGSISAAVCCVAAILYRLLVSRFLGL